MRVFAGKNRFGTVPLLIGGAMLCAWLGFAFPAAASASSTQQLKAGLERSADQGLIGFYRQRDHRPLWTIGDKVDPASRTLVEILRRATLDGMEDGEALASLVENAVVRADAGQPGDLAEAELLLSQAWVQYVRVLRRGVDIGMVYAAGARSPASPFTAQILTAAGDSPDLNAHLRMISELNPVYSRLRAGLAALRAKPGGPLAVSGFSDRQIEEKLLLNLDRARALPIAQGKSFILVDAATAQMFLYEDGQVRDSMRVVVGKPAEATPMVAGLIQNAVLNPYWNVPPDLVRKRAASVVKDGVGSLNGKGFELLSDWSASPQALDPKAVDWAAVAAGTKELRLRQRPGPGNAMGAMKFTFPNDFGVYLHDTPDKSIFALANRRLSSGCIRVEDARRLAGWLFGRVPSTSSRDPEQVVALPAAMPIVVTYLTAGWDGTHIALQTDTYQRDPADTRLASPGSAPAAVANIR